MPLFKRKKKKREIDEAFDSLYEKLAAIDNWDDPKKLEHYILDSCEQIISITKEIEGERAEYRIVTAYLTDIESIEKLSENQRAEISEVAKQIVDLNEARNQYLNAEEKISEARFAFMEEQEEEVPLIIKRLNEHERYQDKMRRDQNVLDAQKIEWMYEREEILKQKSLLRSIGLSLLIFYVLLLILLFVIQSAASFDLTGPFLVLFAVGGFGIFFVYMRALILNRRLKKATKKYNQSVNLLNVTRMKYANVTKSVDYIKERYHVNSSTELNYYWEQYMEAVRQKEIYERNSDDLEFFNGRLMRLLSKVNLHDRKIWLDQAKALIDPDEMIEIRHNLVKRRQNIRNHIEEDKAVVRSERDEIDRLMTEHEHYVPEIVEIIQSVDKLCKLDE